MTPFVISIPSLQTQATKSPKSIMKDMFGNSHRAGAAWNLINLLSPLTDGGVEPATPPCEADGGSPALEHRGILSAIESLLQVLTPRRAPVRRVP